jgi:hypothetical protein
MKPASLPARLLHRFDRTAASLFFFDQWTILLGKAQDPEDLRWEAMRRLVPPADRYWADPFLVQQDGRAHVFIEEKMLASGRGRIACLTLDLDGQLLSNHTVLERPYHLSYPFVFQHRGSWYMLPETAQNRTLEMYRCSAFPDRWEPCGTLMKDIDAVDATLFEHAGKWWLFANVKRPGGSSLDALHLYFADDPLSERWRPHPLNPIVRDIASARPAGRIFRQAGRIIRPAQDNARRYGYAIRFNEIQTLSESEYRELPGAYFAPRGRDILATHTYDRSQSLTVIDAVVRRWKFTPR